MIKGSKHGSPMYQVLEEIQVGIVTETTREVEMEFKYIFLNNSHIFSELHSIWNNGPRAKKQLTSVWETFCQESPYFEQQLICLQELV